MYKSVWIPVEVKDSKFYNCLLTFDGTTILNKSVLLQNILPFVGFILN